MVDGSGPKGELGRRVRRRRSDLGLSQEGLADRAGLHRNYIGGIERGERNVTLANITRLAGALDVDPAWLVTELDPPARPTMDVDIEVGIEIDDRAIAIGLELLVHTTLEALRADNSVLRAELEAARVRIEFLESQLHALSEAHATGHRSITKAILRGVGAILLATSAGAVEGAVSAAWPKPSDERAAVVRPAEMHAADLVAACAELDRQLGP